MKCPKCGLYSPEGTLKCDCGYDFRTGIEPDDAKAKRFAKRGTAIGSFAGGLMAVLIDLLYTRTSVPGLSSAIILTTGLIVGSLLGRGLGRGLARRDTEHRDLE